MIPRLTLHFVLFFFISHYSIAQRQAIQSQHINENCCANHINRKHSKPLHRCGSTLYRQLEEQRNPEIKTTRENLEMETRKWLHEKSRLKSVLTTPVVIPVVVHVVYNENHPEQNISEEQILSQIEALNRDFRRLNSDTINTPDIFIPLASDAMIEFRMARRDPWGNATNGITRTATTVEEFTLDDDDVKYDIRGGKNIWPRDRYMNFWVCNLEESLLGYAQYPGGFSQSDGIVISYRNFGTMGTVVFPFNQGRTVTHEVGHWLNLVHVWGDEDDCEATDFVNDTPNQETNYYHCPEFPQSSCGSIDMFMNYMDYTDDRCMNIFTHGQRDRMHSTLQGFRSSLQRSDALNEPIAQEMWCEIFNSDLMSEPLYNYFADEGGYAIGTNTHNDRAKAQFFANEQNMEMIVAGEIAFGYVHDAGGAVIVAVWEADNNLRPVRMRVAQKQISLSVIEDHVNSFENTHFVFDPPVPINGPFFMGVILPSTPLDTIAILATHYMDEVNAWEQWSNNQWYNFEQSWEGTLNVNLAIFPHVCRIGLPEQLQISMLMGPNPVTDHTLNLYFKNFIQFEPVRIDIFDISGRRVMTRENVELKQEIVLDLSPIRQNGLFIIRVSGDGINVRKKFIVMNQN